MAFTRINNIHVPVAESVVISCNVFLPGNLELDRRSTPEEQIKSINIGVSKYDVVFEYVPYRKDDLIFGRDYSRHGYFAQQDYVSVRADMRGTGDSSGTPDTSKDAEDGLKVLEYFARLDFTSGRSYLFGLSWGGSVALEIAAKYPDSVNGCVALCSNGDRETAINFTQGCLIASELTPFSNMMLARTALPMTRDFSEELWLERLENMKPDILFDRLNQQNRQPMRDYFDTSNAKNAKCPVLLITGFRDYARNGVFDLADEVNGLNAESKVILGPWAHNFPDVALPTLNFDLMGITTMWYQRDYQLSSLPRLSVYCENKGAWYSVTSRTTNSIPILDVSYPLTLKPAHALQAAWNGAWFTKGVHDDPGDQTLANQLSDSFDLVIEEGSTVICGITKVRFSIKEAPSKFYIGASLATRDGSKSIQIASGTKYVEDHQSDVVVELGACCYDTGARPVTLHVRTSGFPVIPTFKAGKLNIRISNIDVSVPVLNNSTSASPVLLRPVSMMPYGSSTVVKKPEFSRNLCINLGGSLPDTVSVKRVTGLGAGCFSSHGIGYSDKGSDTAEVVFDLTGPSKYSAERTYCVEHSKRRCQTTARTTMTVREEEIDAEASLEAFLDGSRIFSAGWQRTFMRRS